nr:histidine kinase [Rhizobium sp. Q54]
MRWHNSLSISVQFLAVSAIVLCVSMTVLGLWVSEQIERSVIATSGADGAAFVRATLEQYVQRMDEQGNLHPDDAQALDRLVTDTPLAQRIVSVKLWRTNGGPKATIIYSSKAKEIIGETFVSTDVQKAWAGTPVAEFKDLVSSESSYEQSLQLPLIEVYAPLYRSGTTNVLAVGEIYQEGSVLAQHLRQALILTWLVVGLTTLLMTVALYLIVRRASLLIQEQQSILSTKVREAEEMAAQNHALRLAADRSRIEANEANEELLGRIGLDIHDGPIQFLTLIRFRMDEIAINLSGGVSTGDSAAKELQELAEKLSSVIDELRDLSVGLVLPELDALSLLQTIKLAVERHEHLTGTRVRAKYTKVTENVTAPLKTCVYRVVQESLSNSFKHAGGRGQRVSASSADGILRLEIADEGRPSKPGENSGKGMRLGQRGIRNRVAAFNGTVTIEPQEVHGTRVTITIPL